MLVLLTIALAMHGTATKFQTSKKVEVSGAVSGSANFDGSKDINIVTKQANISILTGELTINASTSNNKVISYPQQYNKNNCVVMSAGIINKVNESKGYNYIGSYINSSDGLSNAYNRRINLTDSGINLSVTNPNTSSLTIVYKIILLKTT